MLGLGGNRDSDEVEDDGLGDGDTEVREGCLLGVPSTFSAPSPGGFFEGRQVDPVWQKL